MQLKTSVPDFGNWVPVKMIVAPAVLGLVFLALGLLSAWFLAAAVPLLIVAGYFAAARYLFSAGGGNVQERVHELVLAHASWNGAGKALDIGCGNAPLTIKLAQRYPAASVVGVDTWGKDWDYSMQTCAENARRAGVDGQVSFRRGSAAALPFEDASFDLVVSNLVFHEVRDARDKRECIREALRVLKPGGVFALQDLLLLKPYYGTPEELVARVRGWGVSRVELIRTCDAPFLPKLVKLPFIVGTLGLLRGVK
jgi:SAM-dependent methyltransferase